MTAFCLKACDNSPASSDRLGLKRTFHEHPGIQPAIPWRLANRIRLTPIPDSPVFRHQIRAIPGTLFEHETDFGFGRRKTPPCQIPCRLSFFQPIQVMEA